MINYAVTGTDAGGDMNGAYQVFGDFSLDLAQDNEHMTIVFSPSSFSFKERWRNNSLSADFMADYFSNFFPGSDSETAQTSTRTEVKSAISYIANELLENSVKFHFHPNVNISITLRLEQNELVFLCTNSIDPATIEKFQAFINKLLVSDPSELYLEQLEANAVDENSTGSGLGLLTMLQDYGATVAWKFESPPNLPGVVTVTTLVKISVQKLIG